MNLFWELYQHKKRFAAFGGEEAPLLQQAYERFTDDSNGATNIIGVARLMPRATVFSHLGSLAWQLGAKTKVEQVELIKAAMADEAADALLAPSVTTNARETQSCFRALARMFGTRDEIELVYQLCAVQAGMFKRKIIAAAGISARYNLVVDEIERSERSTPPTGDWKDHCFWNLPGESRTMSILIGYSCADDVVGALRGAKVDWGPRFDTYGSLAALIERERL